LIQLVASCNLNLDDLETTQLLNVYVTNPLSTFKNYGLEINLHPFT